MESSVSSPGGCILFISPAPSRWTAQPRPWSAELRRCWATRRRFCYCPRQWLTVLPVRTIKPGWHYQFCLDFLLLSRGIRSGVPSDVLWPSFIMVLVSIPPTAFNGAADPVTPKRGADVPVGGQKAFWFEFLTHPFSWGCRKGECYFGTQTMLLFLGFNFILLKRCNMESELMFFCFYHNENSPMFRD